MSHCLKQWIWHRTGLREGCGRRTALRYLELHARNDVIIIIIIQTLVTRLLQLKNEHKHYICYGKIDKKRLRLGLINIIC